ncbi:hypothetical protein CBR_g4888 [Chara braunii]|uniref:Uncharacterized protein n=1 Tax=Chara braunii TaxID=69332 RepID=A0A388KJ28_CHABU|nr:hypothetical protein CBR_g4888 [Chara braunii]|eukprot:GBG70060.1 hypothetical protein CBR_g4888 [Chara braunii]
MSSSTARITDDNRINAAPVPSVEWGEVEDEQRRLRAAITAAASLRTGTYGGQSAAAAAAAAAGGGGGGGGGGGVREEKSLTFPGTVKYIVGNEFCERFSYYGMKTILALYLNNFLLLSEDSATEAVHMYIVACYFTPLLGAIISDSYWGKYKTILYVSMIYCFGNWVMAGSAVVPSLAGKDSINQAYWVAVAGLGLIALGTGGIKPCVSAYGGDQIELGIPPSPARDVLLRRFFSVFYFSINAGATLSTILTPKIRQYASYSLAFGIPAALMMVALYLFWMGRNEYLNQPPGGNVIGDVIKIIYSACRNRGGRGGEGKHLKVGEDRGRDGDGGVRRDDDNGPLLIKRGGKDEDEEEEEEEAVAMAAVSSAAAAAMAGHEQEEEEGKHEVRFLAGKKHGGNGKIWQENGSHRHWLDGAKAEYADSKVEDVKALGRVLLLFLPAPIFWSLFDQQSSRWVFQAERMDGRFFFGWKIEPDQMQVMNSVFILILIPLFDFIIYPAAQRCGLSVKPVSRMVAGLLMSTFAFLISAALEYRIAPEGEPAHTHSGPSSSPCEANGAACVHILWQVPQYLVITCGEILFSITGLELAYSQAPASMTAVVQSCWLLTVSAGNLFTVFAVSSLRQYLNQWQEFIFFAGWSIVGMFLMWLIGRDFKYLEDKGHEVKVVDGDGYEPLHTHELDFDVGGSHRVAGQGVEDGEEEGEEEDGEEEGEEEDGEEEEVSSGYIKDRTRSRRRGGGRGEEERRRGGGGGGGGGGGRGGGGGGRGGGRGVCSVVGGNKEEKRRHCGNEEEEEGKEGNEEEEEEECSVVQLTCWYSGKKWREVRR